MPQKFLKSLILVSIIFSVLSITTGCDSAPDEPAWHTVFSDNFNRADGALGSKWNIVTSANGSLTISDNAALYATTSGSTNTIVAYSDSSNGIESNKITLSFKFIINSDFPDIETVGFLIKPSPETGKQYCLTFKNSDFALGTKNSDGASWSWLDHTTPTLTADTIYYLELNVDGANFTGYIKDADNNVVYELNGTNEEYSSWNTYFIMMSNDASSAVKFDDYKIKAYY